MGKVCTVRVWCVLTLHWMCVEKRVFYPKIWQRSCHVQHSTINQNPARHSIFNIKDFETEFSTVYWTVRNRILHGKSAYSVPTACSYIAQNVRWKTIVLTKDIAAILPCKALYHQPKSSRTLYFQYRRVWNWFFYGTLYCKKPYITWEKCIQCAYSVFLHCTEFALNNGCFI